MPTTVSDLFEFLERDGDRVIDRHELTSAPFSRLRRCIRQVVVRTQGNDPADEDLSATLRTQICEWLTVPIPFQMIGEAVLRILPTAESVATRWGRDLRDLRDAASRAADEIVSSASPLRDGLLHAIREARRKGLTFKIYCHRRARPHFESLLRPDTDVPLEAGDFLHSVRDYRDSELFNLLIKVGPLRSSGWGSVPAAVLTAPHFTTLAQFVWVGCPDETDFEYDPASTLVASCASALDNSSSANQSFRGGRVAWTRRVAQIGQVADADNDETVDLDDLGTFGEITHHGDDRAATLIQVDAVHGALYPPHSQILTFDPDPTSTEPVGWRISGETLTKGMYIVQPLVSAVDLGTVRAGQGNYSWIWKNELARARDADAPGLFMKLVDEGIDLENLNAAIEHWCRPPTTVIHAPKRIKHFEILLRVLGFGDRIEVGANKKRVPFWRLAWDEVRRSRGEAIQAGFQEHEIVEEELQGILVKLLPAVREKARSGINFELPIPSSNDIKGVFKFFLVSEIQEGFNAPDSVLRTVLPLETFERWRD
jgi:hypothetical protein